MEALAEAPLVHVVLVLADADASGVQLDEFGQGVLQAPRNRDGAADGHIEAGELFAGGLRRGIDGGARFVYERGEVVLHGMLFEDAIAEAGGLAGAGPVSHSDGFCAVLFYHFNQRMLGGRALFFGANEENHAAFEKLAAGA